MEAGRELDALVAEKVFGQVVADAPVGDGLTRTQEYGAATMKEAAHWIAAVYSGHDGLRPAQYCGPEYSTRIAAAWKVLEKLATLHFRYEIADTGPGGPGHVCTFTPDPDGPPTDRAASTAPLAICLAALAAMGESA